MNLARNGIQISKDNFLVNGILYSIFYTAYFVFSFFVPLHVIPFIDNRLMVQTAFNFIIVVTLLSSSFLIHKMNSLRVVCVTSAATSVFTVLLLGVSNDTTQLFILALIAIFFGIGQVAAFKYFWESTATVERGRIAGFIGFGSLLFYLVVITAIAPVLDYTGTVLLGLVLSLGMVAVSSLKLRKAHLQAKKLEKGNYFEKRTFLLYLVPWILFSLINASLAKNISFHVSQQFPSLYVTLTILQVVAAIIGTLVAGLIADFFGRRLAVALSLTSYGLSSALAGIASQPEIFYFVYVGNGLSWGMLLTLYGFAIWGDLSNKENCAKIYSIGLAVFYATQGVGLLPLNQIFMIPLVVSSLASCVLIFLSNVPIALAPELQPSDFREKILLKMHLKAVKKIEEKSQGHG